MAYTLPPIANNAKGDQRTVGLELEFAGIEIDETAQIIQKLYGGQIEKVHRYNYEILGTELGHFRVELDARILRRMASQNLLAKLGIDVEEDSIGKSIEDIVDRLARVVVPLEIVMPPVPIQELHQLEELRDQLQKNRAEGTLTSIIHVFGMHINVEAPDLQITTLLKYLRSFIILYPWLLETLEVDISRRISPFVDPFPVRYARKILEPSYNPDRKQFIRDYLNFNPTRNRPVDMMPIFGMLEPELIQPVMEGEKNDPRPTFHYRLPNSRIDDPDWLFEDEWNHWLAVERLAADEEMLHKLSRLYLVRKKETLISFYREWSATVKILLGLDE